MNSLNAALLVNLLGFTIGVALYAMLAAMVVRHRKPSGPNGLNLLLLTTAFLGLIWNLGEFFVLLQNDFGSDQISPLIVAASYSALGFLPSVVVHSSQNDGEKATWLAYGAYGLSTFASVLHFHAAFTAQLTPSDLALQTLTFGSITLAAGLLFFNFRQTVEKKAIWATSLLIFAVSALHLSGDRAENSWLVELVAHQSSLPLALAILYQNYRFAFADLFLKRAISLILLTLVAFGLYLAVAAPLLRYHETHDRNDVQAVSLILTLWIATALIYPAIHRLAIWLVDKVILQRADYGKVERELALKIEKIDSVEEVLTTMTDRLGSVLTANEAGWDESLDRDTETKFELVDFSPDSARVFIPTAEPPFFRIHLSEFHGGRRLLSDETAMLESVSLNTARRIDALRVSHERFEQAFREQEFSKLAAEAQLTALRSQINPHFLFNALTTIGYLIQTSPDKAFQTLLQLTKLLRGVLSTAAEFSTLAEEMKLIESYLDIERARFEERLKVTIHIPKEVEGVRIPSLILQPLVENAVKHGISENKAGGEVCISAELTQRNGEAFLRLRISDTGPGRILRKVFDSDGVGLRNVRARLNTYFGGKGTVNIDSDPRNGTQAVIEMPLEAQTIPQEYRSESDLQVNKYEQTSSDNRR
ncbi:MAG: histidine kinase [Saprospiraceae bacterium]|nr:histidine kinase [Pyrinomonadaceae bacterium]